MLLKKDTKPNQSYIYIYIYMHMLLYVHAVYALTRTHIQTHTDSIQRNSLLITHSQFPPLPLPRNHSNVKIQYSSLLFCNSTILWQSSSTHYNIKEHTSEFWNKWKTKQKKRKTLFLRDISTCLLCFFFVFFITYLYIFLQNRNSKREWDRKKYTKRKFLSSYSTCQCCQSCNKLFSKIPLGDLQRANFLGGIFPQFT